MGDGSIWQWRHVGKWERGWLSGCMFQVWLHWFIGEPPATWGVFGMTLCVLLIVPVWGLARRMGMEEE